MIKAVLIIAILGLMTLNSLGQGVPAPEENIPFLVTFGNEAPKKYGDDDHCQTFFFSIPKTYTKPFYIRIFDPETGGENDERVKNFNTTTLFSFYGGKGCISEQDAREVDPMGQFKSGNLLYKKEFGSDEKYDNKWTTIGPFNAQQGEYAEQYFGYIFKLICEGTSGDDGNLYRYFLSTSPNENIPVPGGNAFTFEYTFRLHKSHKQISHIYPFVDENVISVKQHNFDGDDDGELKLFSVRSKDVELALSGDNESAESVYNINSREKGTSLDIQIIKSAKDSPNNNLVFYVTNQYGQAMPFYTIPIGGIPKYKGNLIVKPTK
ncbi:hypothetical protein [Parvicella tangerina]|uniref:Uncharacterized protein n=1 Tax=Parvicella tangerina TaxID=2829795 RepID=A0A916NFP0_9FLAO|nr:hypothetical protein [Parvicella tangerina]CAG5078276.1 hypothetical protein CRYO30217_00628 [Parvicella tangerina]